MNAKQTKQAPKFSTAVVVNGKTVMEYATKVEGKNVEVYHPMRRRYTLRINGNDVPGYFTARDVMNAVARVETAGSIKALKALVSKKRSAKD